MRISISTPKGTIHGVLNDSVAAQTFAAQLPITITFNDLLGREKYGKLPSGISLKGKRIFHFEKSLIAYWSPGNDFVLFYNYDGEPIPAPGLIALGRITKGVSILSELTSSFTASISLSK